MINELENARLITWFKQHQFQTLQSCSESAANYFLYRWNQCTCYRV